MKKIIPSVLALIAAVLTGCIQLEDTLTVKGDGSGSWKFDIALGPQMTAMMASGGSQGKNTLFKEVEFRSAVAKIKGARVVSYSVKSEKDGLKVKGEIAFQSIVAVYRSKAFDEQLNWEFKKVGENLVAEIRTGMMGGSSDDSDIDLTSDMDFKAVKGLLVGMKMDRTLVLPNAVISGNAKEKKGKRARWVYEITKDTTEAQFKKTNAERPKAISSAAGVSFKLPLTPKDSAPLDLTDFSTDNAAIQAQLDQVKIRPLRARLMRTAKYDPKDNMSYGNAPLTLSTVISWPAELRPSGWSHLTVEAGRDNTGAVLKLTRTRPERVNELRPRHGKENESDLELNISAPGRNADRYSVKGAVVLHVPSSIRSIKVPGIKGLVGKSIDVPGLEAFGLKVKSFSGSSLQLSATQAVDSIIDFKLVSADLSQEQKKFHLNRSKFGDEHRLQAGFMSGRTKLENPTLIIVVAGEVGKYAVPFAFTDLKMP